MTTRSAGAGTVPTPDRPDASAGGTREGRRSRARSWGRRWGVLLVVLAVALPGSVVFAFLTADAVGIELFLVAVALVMLWNFRTAWVAWRRWRATPSGHPGRRRELLLFLAALGTATVWGPGFVLLFSGAAILEVMAALFALLWSIARLRHPTEGPRSRLALFLPIYNAFALLGALAWALALSAAGPAGAGGAAFYGLVRAGGLFQELEVTFLAGFVPAFVLPPVLPELTVPKTAAAGSGEAARMPRAGVASEEAGGGPPGPGMAGGLPLTRGWRRRPGRRGGPARLLRTMVAAVVIFGSSFLVVVSPLGFVESGGWASLPEAGSASYAVEPGFPFAVVAASLTDTISPPTDFSSVVAHEIALAQGLGVSYVRFDLQEELLHAPQGPADLREAVGAIRNASMGVILSPFGEQGWGGHHPSPQELNATILNESLYLAGTFHPDYLFPFYEPNGQLQVDLGGPLPPSTWRGMIAATAAAVKEVSPGTRVLIEVADNAQGLPLAQMLLDLPNVDAIGFDLYPGSPSDLAHVDPYADLLRGHPGKAFWISEMGMETTTFGPDAQARFIAAMVSRATERWNASGLCVWGLEDNVGLGLGSLTLDTLGLVTQGWLEKPGYAAYRTAIDHVHASG